VTTNTVTIPAKLGVGMAELNILDSTGYLDGTNSHIRRRKGALPFIQVLLGSKSKASTTVMAMADTGCNQSCVDYNFLKSLADFNDIAVTKVEEEKLNLAGTGTSVKVLGKANLYVTFRDPDNNSIRYFKEFVIADGLNHSVYLGSDIFSTPNVKFITPEHVIFTNNPEGEQHIEDMIKHGRDPKDEHENPWIKMPLLLVTSEVKHELKLRSDIVIPAGRHITTYVQPVTTIHPSLSKIQYQVRRPKESNIAKGISVKEDVLSIKHTSTIEVTLYNHSKASVQIKSGTKVGELIATEWLDFIRPSTRGTLATVSLDQLDISKYVTAPSINMMVLEKVEKYPVGLKAKHTIEKLQISWKEAPKAEVDKQEAESSEDDNNDNDLYEDTDDLKLWANKDYFNKPDGNNPQKYTTVEEMTTIESTPDKTDSQICQEVDIEHLSKEQKAAAFKVIWANNKVFGRGPTDVGKTHLVEGYMTAKPHDRVMQQKYIGFKSSDKAQVDEILRSYEKIGLIGESEEDDPYISNLLVARKKNGKIRLIADSRLTNVVTQKQATSVPSNIDVITLLQGAKFITTMDCANAFHSIPIRERDRKYFSFQTSTNRIMHWLRLPQGWTNSPFFMECLMQEVFHGISYILCYCDDILVATTSQNFADHLDKVNEVLQALVKAGLKVTARKLHIGAPKLDFLGMMISPTEMNIPAPRVVALESYPTPKTARQIKSFLGSASFYRSFIPKYSNIVSPLQELATLARPDRRLFKWTQREEDSFKNIKDAIRANSIRYIPDQRGEFVCIAEANSTGISFTINQRDNQGSLRLIHSITRSLSKTEKGYEGPKLEAAAIVHGFKLGRLYLQFATKIILHMDVRAIMLLHLAKASSSMLRRFALIVGNFNITVHHKDRVEEKPEDKGNYTKSEETDNKKKPTTAVEKLHLRPGQDITASDILRILKPKARKAKRTVKARKAVKTTRDKKTSGRTPTEDCGEQHPRSGLHSITSDQPHGRYPVRIINSPEQREQEQVAVAAAVLSHSDAVRRPADVHRTRSDVTMSQSGGEHEDRQRLSDCSPADSQVSHSQNKPTLDLTLVRRECRTGGNPGPRVAPCSGHLMVPLPNSPGGVVRSLSERSGISGDFTNAQEKSRRHDLLGRASSEVARLSMVHVDGANASLQNTQTEDDSDISTFALQTKLMRDGDLSGQQFRTAQEMDTEISDVYSLVKSRDCNSSVILKNLLYYTGPKDGQDSRKHKVALLWIPGSILQLHIRHHHFNSLAMHKTANQIYNSISTEYYTTNLREKIESYCRACYYCNMDIDIRTHKIRPNHQAPYPRHSWMIGYVRHVNETKNGNNSVMLLVDHVSLYTLYVPIKTESSFELVQSLKERLFPTFQIPILIVGEDNSAGRGKEFLQMCSDYGIKYDRTATQEAWRSSKAYRCIQMQLGLLTEFCRRNRHDWDEKLHLIATSYNEASTKSPEFPESYATPSKHMFGLDTPTSLLSNVPRHQLSSGQIADFTEWHLGRISLLQRLMDDRLEETKAARESDNHKSRTKLTFRKKVGEKVWIQGPLRREDGRMVTQKKGPLIIVSLQSGSATLCCVATGEIIKAQYGHMILDEHENCHIPDHNSKV